MKNVFYLALFFGIFGFTAKSQAQISVNVNIGAQPLWGPTGYDYAQYYYMPEMDVYYDVSNRNYVYMQGNRWIVRASLPSRYRNYDLYRTYKVVLNHRSPWHNHRKVRNQYGRYAHNHNQGVRRGHHYDSGRNHRRSNHSYGRVERGNNHRSSRNNKHMQHYERNGGRQQKFSKQQHKKSNSREHRGNRGNQGNRGKHGHGNHGHRN